jgi:hypothetical protein
VTHYADRQRFYASPTGRVHASDMLKVRGRPFGGLIASGIDENGAWFCRQWDEYSQAWLPCAFYNAGEGLILSWARGGRENQNSDVAPIYVLGWFTSLQGVPLISIPRQAAWCDGNTWHALPPIPSTFTATAIGVSKDGTVFLGGAVSSAATQPIILKLVGGVTSGHWEPSVSWMAYFRPAMVTCFKAYGRYLVAGFDSQTYMDFPAISMQFSGYLYSGMAIWNQGGWPGYPNPNTGEWFPVYYTYGGNGPRINAIAGGWDVPAGQDPGFVGIGSAYPQTSFVGQSSCFHPVAGFDPQLPPSNYWIGWASPNMFGWYDTVRALTDDYYMGASCRGWPSYSGGMVTAAWKATLPFSSWTGVGPIGSVQGSDYVSAIGVHRGLRFYAGKFAQAGAPLVACANVVADAPVGGVTPMGSLPQGAKVMFSQVPAP